MTGLVPSSSKRISMWPLGQSSSPKVSIGRTRVIPGVSLETESESLNCEYALVRLYLNTWVFMLCGCMLHVWEWGVPTLVPYRWRRVFQRPISKKAKSECSREHISATKTTAMEPLWRSEADWATETFSLVDTGESNNCSVWLSKFILWMFWQWHSACCLSFRYENERSELYGREHTFHPEEPTIGTNICDWDR